MTATPKSTPDCDVAGACPYVEDIAEMRNDLTWVKRIGGGVFLLTLTILGAVIKLLMQP